MVCFHVIGMLPIVGLDPNSDSPLYRHLYLQIKELVDSNALAAGTRLPATRELAGQLGLNRNTVSAAYELLEAEGLIKGHVGRGSFVEERSGGVAWDDVLEPSVRPVTANSPALLSFST